MMALELDVVSAVSRIALPGLIHEASAMAGGGTKSVIK